MNPFRKTPFLRSIRIYRVYCNCGLLPLLLRTLAVTQRVASGSTRIGLLATHELQKGSRSRETDDKRVKQWKLSHQRRAHNDGLERTPLDEGCRLPGRQTSA